MYVKLGGNPLETLPDMSDHENCRYWWSCSVAINVFNVKTIQVRIPLKYESLWEYSLAQHSVDIQQFQALY